jgi:formylglycine-generating enzyme required for sulfatase activity
LAPRASRCDHRLRDRPLPRRITLPAACRWSWCASRRHVPMGSTQSATRTICRSTWSGSRRIFTWQDRRSRSASGWRVMQPNPVRRAGNPDLPVEGLPWNLCAKFVDKLNTHARGTFRMPSEAELEYAAAPAATTRWFCGTNPRTAPYAWTGANSKGTTHAVGASGPSPFDFATRIRGVFEMVADWYNPTTRARRPTGSAGTRKTPENPWRVCRGGAFHMGETISTPAYRRSSTRRGTELVRAAPGAGRGITPNQPEPRRLHHHE